YVVDTLGNVEPSSIEFLPGTDALQALVARTTIAQWHFMPAEWGGSTVRQIVQQPISFDVRPREAADSSQIEVYGEADGWVHFHVPGHGLALDAQEWFAPDSVMAWAKRVAAIMPSNETRDYGPTMKERSEAIGSPTGVRFTAAFGTQG